MATRKKSIAIEQVTDSFYIVWIDATLTQLHNVEGIGRVMRYHPGKFNVTIDPRYDPEEVLAEIRALGGDDVSQGR